MTRCKDQSSTIKCSSKAHDCDTVLSSIRSIHGQGAIDECLPCRCDKFEYAYSTDEFCREIVKSIVVSSGEETSFAARRIPRAEVKAETSTVDPWENWCKHKCAEGLGGAACECDIIP